MYTRHKAIGHRHRTQTQEKDRGERDSLLSCLKRDKTEDTKRQEKETRQKTQRDRVGLTTRQRKGQGHRKKTEDKETRPKTETNLLDRVEQRFVREVSECLLRSNLSKRSKKHPRGGGLGSSTIFKKFHETYAPS